VVEEMERQSRLISTPSHAWEVPASNLDAFQANALKQSATAFFHIPSSSSLEAILLLDALEHTQLKRFVEILRSNQQSCR
jgi:hypothetical protein